MHRVGLIVGNGISIDYRYHSKKKGLPYFDTSNPIDLAINDESLNLRQFEGAKRAITHYRKLGGGISDFDLILKIHDSIDSDITKNIRSSMDLSDHWTDDNIHKWIITAMRQIVCRSFVKIHLSITHSLDKDWRWAVWLRNHAKYINFIVSLNYDLLIEDILFDMKFLCQYIYKADIASFKGIPLFKPHGSINYRCPNTPAFKEQLTSRSLNNMPIKVIKENQLLDMWGENVVSDGFILPGEFSQVTNFQYNIPGYHLFRQAAPQFTHVVIIGISYWHCDRPELDALLESIDAGTKVFLVDPCPNELLVEKIKSRTKHFYKCQDELPLIEGDG